MTEVPPTVDTEKLYAGVHTITRMQRQQLGKMSTRKCREQLLPRLPIDFDQWYERQIPEALSIAPEPLAANSATLRRSFAVDTRERYRTRAREAAAGTPTFMNQTLRIADETGVAWFDTRLDDLPMLWRLKLYAFQPLYWAVLGFSPENRDTDCHAAFDHWIQDWRESVAIDHPGYLRREWTPWAVSLRLLYWCRYLVWRGRHTESLPGELDRDLKRACYKNALFLRNHIEWDVGGNHLVENGAALVVAGTVFEETAWIDEGVSVLTTVAETQFLRDGCHFERSPMYHILTLTRYLTVCDLLDKSGREVPDTIRQVTTAATAFLEFLRPADGRMPLLNDSVYGQALSLEDCLRYADALGFGDAGDGVWVESPGDELTPTQTSGYQWLRTEDGDVLFDGGAVGPPHLPGHSHSDTLSVLLWIGGQPVVTDTGTYGYVSETDREYARGVRGHNTVQVGELEPIPLGGKYLMGPRPVPTTRVVDGPITTCEGRYEANPYRGPSYDHHRVVYAGNRWWLLRDRIAGCEGKPARSRLHLHPAVDPSIEKDGRVVLSLPEQDVFVYPFESDHVGLSSSKYFPRFGVEKRRPVIEFHAEENRTEPLSLGCLISTRDVEHASFEADEGDGTTRLRVGEEEYTLPDTALEPSGDFA